jgi:adenosylcobinamide hydrolase
MRYYTGPDTLFIRGAFRAASTGIAGGIRNATTLFNHTVPADWSHEEPAKEIALIAAAAGAGSDVLGQLTAVPIRNLCVLQYDFITVFVTAGIRQEPAGERGAGTINIIAYSGEGLEDAALLETIMVATEAKTEALLAAGRVSGTPTDAMIAACEGDAKHQYAGRITEPGRRVRDAVLKGVPEALRRYESGVITEPAFFIYSRFEGGHWVEWLPHNCPYYPCHFAGQACDFCYCPFYPCRNEELGEWSASSTNGRVWNCSGCTLLHEPAVADYLKRYPDAPLAELMRLKPKQKK